MLRCNELVAIAVLASGCSFVYDDDGFIAAAPDAGVEPPESGPNGILIQELEPAVLDEGAGTARPIPIVVHGRNLTVAAQVSISGSGFNGPVLKEVSDDGTILGFALSIPVFPELGEGEESIVEVTVAQGGISETLPLTIRGLPELVASEAAPGGQLDVADLRPLYSTITIDAPVAFTGEGAARLVATSSIQIDAPLSADGAGGSGASGGAGDAGGCNGGADESPGGCDGGGPGGSSSGGGGGGHAGSGEGGSGGSAGNPGPAAGDPAMLDLASEGGSGGGGGGGGSVGGNGGGGGAGGGVIELTSRGELHIGEAGAVSAAGGDGAPGTGSCELFDQHGGGGGGGAGGAVLIRSAGSITDAATESRIVIAGGSGGDGGCNQGGDGAPGRARIDVPGDSSLPVFAASSSARGPVLDAQTSVLAGTSPLEVTLFGAEGASYAVEDQALRRVSVAMPGDARSQTATVELDPGLNEICALVTPDANSSLTESVQCITIAYIPQS